MGIKKIENIKTISMISDWQCVGTSCVFHPSVTVTCGRGIAVGNNVHIGADCYLNAQGGIQIGDNVHVSRRVTIYSSDHDFRADLTLPFGKVRKLAQVIIERNVWIGMNASILPGVRIGEGAIVGMGAVITKDVPAFAIVGPAPQRILGRRDESAYRQAEFEKCYGAVDGRSLPKPLIARFLPNGRAKEPRLVFVVSTGRAGSATIAKTLDQHPQISARHEARIQLIRWSTQFGNGEISAERMFQNLEELYKKHSVYREDLIYIESDQKLFNLIPFLQQMFPRCKFVWLVRKAQDCVASTFGRGWFRSEANLPTKDVDWQWNHYRIGPEANSMKAQSLLNKTHDFEKNCWYWSHVNSEIERNLKVISKERWILIRLEELSDLLNGLQEFIGVEAKDLVLKRVNVSHYNVHKSDLWSKDEWGAYERHCKPVMQRLYPDIEH